MSALKRLDGRNWGPLYDGNPCGCCGMTYTPSEKLPKTPPRTTGKGIRVLEGKVGSEKKAEKIHITHVETKNGPLTVIVKVAE